MEDRRRKSEDESEGEIAENGKHERRSDTGPVINEESNFQVGDLTSSRPMPVLLDVERGTLKKVAEGGRKGWEGRWSRYEGARC